MPGFENIPYNDLGALKAKLEADPNIVAFMVEPIQVCLCLCPVSELHACPHVPADPHSGILECEGAYDF